jgi:glycerophosphoryl diester phosphodiesterase
MPWSRPTTLDEFWDGSMPRVIAHRGFSGRAPENTLIAFQRAIDARADMVELDVLLSGDGEVVVIHDETLDRTTSGSGPVLSQDLEALRRLDAGSWFDPSFAGERLPILAEVLDQLRGRILLNVEIKAGLSMDTQAILVPKLADQVLRRDMTQQVMVSSFDPRALVRLRAVAPEIQRASLYSRQVHHGLRPNQVTAQVAACAFHVGADQLDDEMLRDAAAHDLPVAVYTVNDRQAMAFWIEKGVSAIFTDRPDVMVDLVRP